MCHPAVQATQVTGSATGALGPDRVAHLARYVVSPRTRVSKDAAEAARRSPEGVALEPTPAAAFTGQVLARMDTCVPVGLSMRVPVCVSVTLRTSNSCARSFTRRSHLNRPTRIYGRYGLLPMQIPNAIRVNETGRAVDLDPTGGYGGVLLFDKAT